MNKPLIGARHKQKRKEKKDSSVYVLGLLLLLLILGLSIGLGIPLANCTSAKNKQQSSIKTVQNTLAMSDMMIQDLIYQLGNTTTGLIKTELQTGTVSLRDGGGGEFLGDGNVRTITNYTLYQLDINSTGFPSLFEICIDTLNSGTRLTRAGNGDVAARFTGFTPALGVDLTGSIESDSNNRQDYAFISQSEANKIDFGWCANDNCNGPALSSGQMPGAVAVNYAQRCIPTDNIQITLLVNAVIEPRLANNFVITEQVCILLPPGSLYENLFC